MKDEKYFVTGMTCSACSSKVQKNIDKLEGVEEVSVNLLTNSMQVKYDQDILSKEVIIETVNELGYGITEADKDIKNDNSNKASKNVKSEIGEMKHRLIWSFIFLIPMMYISMYHMIYDMLGLSVPNIILKLFHGRENALIFSFSQFILLIPILYLNQKYYKNGFKNLFKGSPNMDSLIAIGSGAAIVYGVIAIFRIGYGLGHMNYDIVDQYSSDLYFESAGMILTLITLGKYLESKSKGKTSEAIEKLINLAPKKATVIREGIEKTILIEELMVGDVVIAKPGENIAADGIIIEGNTSIDESAITGESIPVEKTKGDKVVSATLNKSGYIKFEAQRVGKDSTINQIIKLVDEASASKAPIAKMADKISGVFVPIVILVAIISMLGWLIAGESFEFALSIGISILVISCPCALGLATPVAIMVGTGKGAENGILIKSGKALESAHSIDVVVMDKTGTITKGKPVVTDIINYNIDKNDLMSIAMGLEEKSEHPLAESIINYGKENNIDSLEMSEFKAIFGKGITAREKKSIYLAGNEELMLENNITMDAKYNETINKLADGGKTPIIIAKDTDIIGIIAVADVEKETSMRAIEEFKKMNIDIVMLTGDNKRTAEAIRKRLNIPKVIAGVLPQEKDRHIALLQEQGHKVAMIGDGINDAPALARADVGIAIGAGTDIAIESADAVLMRNDLLDAVSAVKLSKAVIRNIKENLFWAFFYNIIGIPLAAGLLYPAFGIKLSPMFGAAAMSFSSVCVVLNALRLKFFKTRSISKIKEEKIMERELKIEGMMCEHCKKSVVKALLSIDGVTEVIVNLDEKKANVKMNKEITIEKFEKTIEDAGYKLIK